MPDKLDEILWRAADGEDVEPLIGQLAPREAQRVRQLIVDYRALFSARTSPFLARHGWTASILGKELSGFRILAEIGRGGMGAVVFEAAQQPLGDRIVAVKVLPPEVAADPRIRGRFLREARAAGGLEHRHICQVHAAGEHDGYLYIAMKRVHGMRLDHWVAASATRQLAFPVREVATQIAAAAEGLVFAHARGVVHRDIKPSNLMVENNGNLLIVDFGLAHLAGERTLTGTSEHMGTPNFMSPQQVSAHMGTVDERTDVYSLGVTLYTLLAGRPPFAASSVHGIYHAILTEEPLRLRRINEQVPRELETIVQRAIEKSLPRRYQFAADLAADLRRFLAGEAIRARPPVITRRVVAIARRHPLRTGAVITGVLLVGTWVAWSSLATLHALSDARQALQTCTSYARDYETLLALTQHDDVSLTQRFLSAEELAECHRGLVAVSHCRQLIDRLLQDAESDLRHANVLVLVRWAEIDDGYRRIDELRTECARLSRGEVIVSSEIEATDSDLKYRYASMHLPEPRHPERTVVLEMEVEQPAVEVYLFRYDVVDGTAPEQPPRLIPTPLDAPEPVRWATMSAVAIDAMAPDATLLRTGDLIVQVKSLPTPNTFGDVLDQLGITVIRDALEVPLSVPCATLVATRGWVTGYPLITGPGNRCVVTKRDGHCSARVDNMVPGRYLVLLRQRNYLDLRIPLLIASNNETVHIPMATTRMVPCDNLPDQFVWVPAGDVELGGDLQAYGTETRRPKHVDGFFIARHEVTVGEYVLFLNDPTTMALALASVEQVKHVVRDASPCTPMPEGVRIVDLPRSPGMPVGTRQLSFAAGRFHANCDPTLPIMGVSFLDAKDYCDWLGRQSHNERWHFDLPTAIQWECAARGKDGRFFPWGDSFDPRACLGSRTAPRVDSPAPVGSTVLDESPYGVQDLAGNVREWNRPEPEDNRQWALLRGGCWRDNDRTKFHSAARDSKTLDEVDDRCGFRVVATLK